MCDFSLLELTHLYWAVFLDYPAISDSKQINIFTHFLVEYKSEIKKKKGLLSLSSQI